MNNKICKQCSLKKPPSSFYRFKNKGSKAYLRGTCKLCYSDYMKRFRQDNPDMCRDWDLRGSYGMSLVEYNYQSAKQGSRCLICDRKTKLVVDHCHTTGKFRGLLCNKCNMGLGRFDDSVSKLEAALQYVRAHS